MSIYSSPLGILLMTCCLSVFSCNVISITCSFLYALEVILVVIVVYLCMMKMLYIIDIVASNTCGISQYWGWYLLLELKIWMSSLLMSIQMFVSSQLLPFCKISTVKNVYKENSYLSWICRVFQRKTWYSCVVKFRGSFLPSGGKENCPSKIRKGGRSCV